jgi:hypothetical protein
MAGYLAATTKRDTVCEAATIVADKHSVSYSVPLAILFAGLSSFVDGVSQVLH